MIALIRYYNNIKARRIFQVVGLLVITWFVLWPRYGIYEVFLTNRVILPTKIPTTVNEGTTNINEGTTNINEGTTNILPARFWRWQGGDKLNEEVANDIPDASTFNNTIIHEPNSTYCNMGLKLMVLVKSSLPNFRRRQLIRETWGSINKVSATVVKTFFLIGYPQPNTDYTIDNVKNEVMLYNDLIVGSFVDSYKNLTIKTIMGFKWAHSYCNSVQYIISADDDVYLNLYKIVERLETNDPSHELECGRGTSEHAKPKRRGKWSISFYLYNATYFPPYCYGMCYGMSRTVLTSLQKQFATTPTDLSVDDVVVTGILRIKSEIELGYMNKNECVYISNSDKLLEIKMRMENVLQSKIFYLTHK